ncbi:MAG: DAK2 domain-containing protein [Christensenellales bacterium]
MTQKTKINGTEFRDMLIAGAALLERSKKSVDALNVFPVPDGDTGTNMSMTMNSAVQELRSSDATDVSTVAAVAARGALRGARGNSGVILSQLLRGFSRAVDGLVEIDAVQMARALKMGSEAAYKAVMKPKEGTILTVARVVADKAVENAAKGMNILRLIDCMIEDGEEILSRTPDMLPVLKQAGVVDSGGKGLLAIYRGYKMSLDGEELPDAEPTEEESASIDREENEAAIFSDDDLENITFGYCTEFFIERLPSDFSADDLNRFKERIQRIGDSVVVVGDAGLVKVHVHTDVPGKALQMALRLGELNGVKIENMREQHRRLMEERKSREKECGTVAISMGEGLDSIFKDLSVDSIVAGGQTMNPSAMDIEKAIKRTYARNVYVLPNNKNIILAAEQAKNLIESDTDIKVHVIPTTSVTQGIAAMVAYSPESEAKENISAMTEAAQAVKSGSVTFAVRDTSINGFDIKQGNIMAMLEGEIVACGESVQEAAEKLIDQMTDEDSSYITILYGKDVERSDAEALLAAVEEKYPMADIVLQYGGQPLYYYFISVE